MGRGEVGLPEKELGPPSSSAHTQGLPCKALGMEAQEALSFGGSSRDPLRKEAGCLGPGEHVCVCVVCACMRTGTCAHVWLGVDVTLRVREGDMVGTTRAYRMLGWNAG